MSDVELDFSAWLASFWDLSFAHSYKMPANKGSASHWHRWRTNRSESGNWTCTSLRHAADQFVWDYITDAQGRGNSGQHRETIQIAIADADSVRTVEACEKIFRWGGVGTSPRDPSRRWIQANAATGRLIEKINEAQHLLSGANDPASSFDGRSLLMNSAMAKVYAFACQGNNIPIYDGRVGSALARLSAFFSRDREFQSIPNEMKFAWLDGRTRKRNPSEGAFRFPRLGNNQIHASSAWRATRVLNEAARIAGCSVVSFEQALFMVGYDVGSVESRPATAS